MSDAEIEIEAIGIEVSSQPIELYKILKIANAVEGGGEAKLAIAEGYVYVNGELETRKRRKLYADDVVYFDEEYYLVICDPPATTHKPEKPKNSTTQQNNTASSSTSTEPPAKRGRKPISFK